MRRFVALAAALWAACAPAQNRGDCVTIATADPVGAPSLQSTFMDLCEDGGFQIFNEAECSLVGVGTREFDLLNLHADDAAGKEVYGTAAIDARVTPSPGKNLSTADSERWRLMGATPTWNASRACGFQTGPLSDGYGDE